VGGLCNASLTSARDKNFERETVVDEPALLREGLRRGKGEVKLFEMRANLNARLSAGKFQLVDGPATYWRSISRPQNRRR
jgi:hypothetical protein